MAAECLSGSEIRRLMRCNHRTIKELALSMGVTQIRVRAVREHGVEGPVFVRDWVEAIHGRTSR